MRNIRLRWSIGHQFFREALVGHVSRGGMCRHIADPDVWSYGCASGSGSRISTRLCAM